MSERYAPSNTDTTTTAYDEGERPHPQYIHNSPSFLKAFPHSAPANPMLPTLPCPVSVCSLVFKGEMPHGYLWRHLNNPGLYGRTGSEKDEWLQLHKIERDRLLATRVTPAQRKREVNKVKAQKMSRTIEFELRAREMGITDKVLVDQKVAIWEGMWAAEQNGDSIEYGAWVLLDFCTSP